MDKFLSRSSSSSSLNNKRNRDEDTSDGWQLPKRTATVSSSEIASEKPRFTTPNRFSNLFVDPTQGLSEPLKHAVSVRKNPTRVPPIIIQIQDKWTHGTIKGMIEKIDKNFHLQYRNNNRVAVQCYSAATHKLIIDGLRADNVQFHTFTRKDEKMTKVVIRGLPAYFEATLAEDLNELGFQGATVTKLGSPSHVSATCPSYLVQFPPGIDIVKFRQIKYIGNCAVEITRFKANKSAGTQCYRCQNFGHAARNCNLPPRCVKCTEPHETKECNKKDRSTPAHCCNCKEEHPANYPKCPQRLSYLERLKVIRTEARPAIQTRIAPNMRPVQKATFVRKDRTWADIASSTNPEEQPPQQIPTLNLGQDPTTQEMLDILRTIQTMKSKFLQCNSFLDKVVLILTHLGHYV